MRLIYVCSPRTGVDLNKGDSDQNTASNSKNRVIKWVKTRFKLKIDAEIKIND